MMMTLKKLSDEQLRALTDDEFWSGVDHKRLLGGNRKPDCDALFAEARRRLPPWQCECGHEAYYGDGLYERAIPWQPWDGALGHVCERCRQLIDFGKVLDEQNVEAK